MVLDDNVPFVGRHVYPAVHGRRYQTIGLETGRFKRSHLPFIFRVVRECRYGFVEVLRLWRTFSSDAWFCVRLRFSCSSTRVEAFSVLTLVLCLCEVSGFGERSPTCIEV
jgi:hypothetical protein